MYYFNIYKDGLKAMTLNFEDIPEGGLRIGSESQSHIFIPGIAPQQALIYKHLNNLRIRNLNPSIKMKLNGIVVADSILEYGDKIQIGNYLITFDNKPDYVREEAIVVELASKWKRFFNYLIDSIVMSLLIIFIGYITLTFISYYPLAIYIIEGSAIVFLYYFVLESTTHKTIGKLITGTIVVTENFEETTPSQIAIRTLCRFIPFDPLSYLFTETGWHDSLSKTRVVEAVGYLYFERR